VLNQGASNFRAAPGATLHTLPPVAVQPSVLVPKQGSVLFFKGALFT
jgi:hypothetical protein